MRNKTWSICQQTGHTIGTCEWRYKTKRVPCSTPLHPNTRKKVCSELAEYVKDFLKVMEKEMQTPNRPVVILEHDATKEEVVRWVTEFERYFESKEKELMLRGYRPVNDRQIILNAYIDHKLEN